MTAHLISAFSLGVLSTMHCLFMCGGISGALTASLDLKIKLKNTSLLRFILAYNMGRIFSYSLAGAIAGSIGYGFLHVTNVDNGNLILTLSSNILLFFIGLYFFGWFPSLGKVQSLGKPIWRNLEPIGQKLLPVKTYKQAFLFGMIWGWLPCVIVYSTLIWMTLMARGATDGLLIMATFGIGTLPFVFATGFLASSMIQYLRKKQVRMGAGVLLMTIAIFNLYQDLYLTQEHIHIH